MKVQTSFYIFLLILIMFFSTTNVYAMKNENNKLDNVYNSSLEIGSTNEMTSNIVSFPIDNFVQITDGCGGSNAILGSVNDPNSVAWLLQKILNYVRVIAPFLVLLLSSIEYLKVIFTSDDESLNKAHSKLIVRLVLAAALFVLPTLVSVLLNLLGFTSSEVCGLQ